MSADAAKKPKKSKDIEEPYKILSLSELQSLGATGELTLLADDNVSEQLELPENNEGL